MKAGRTITELAQELERQNNAKRDYVADTRTMTVRMDPVEQHGGPQWTRPRLHVEGVDDSFHINRITHGQIAQRTRIPKRHYDRLMDDYPELYQDTVNTILRQEHARRMVRTLDGNARAFLSDRYRRLDNFDLLVRTIPILQESPAIEFASCEITDRRMFVKVVFPRLQKEVQKGDVVQAMVTLSNSEVGEGSFKVEPGVLRLVCLNGMTSTVSLKKYHVGRQIGSGDMMDVFTDETLEADDHAFWLKVQDVVRASMNEAHFATIVDKLKESTENQLDDPVKSVEVLSNKFGLTEADSSGILTALIKGDDAIGNARLTQYGLIQAVTAYSQSVDDYERATEFEALGGKILELPSREWNQIALAS